MFHAQHGGDDSDTKPTCGSQQQEATCDASTLKPLILHLDPLAGKLHDTHQITRALVEWLRYELQRESGAEISSAAALSAVDIVRVCSDVVFFGLFRKRRI